MSGSGAQPVILLYDSWESEVVQKLRGMLARNEPALITIMCVGNTTILLIDRRIPCGRIEVS